MEGLQRDKYTRNWQNHSNRKHSKEASFSSRMVSSRRPTVPPSKEISKVSPLKPVVRR